MEFVPLVSVVIQDEEGRILFVVEKKEVTKGRLNLPGGHLEFGETIMEGAMREAREEVSVDVELMGLIGIYCGIKKQAQKQFFHYIFTARVCDGVPAANLNEVQDIAWQTKEEIDAMDEAKLVSPTKLKRVLDRVKQGSLFSVDLLSDLPIQS